MIRGDYHVHSIFSDGKHSPEEICARAFGMGLKRLGFSDHGYAAYDTECCIPKERQAEYRKCVAALREQYRGRMEVFCGVEQDIFSDASTAEYDYVIGSVHYLSAEGEYCAVDDTPERLEDAVERRFGGDWYAAAEEYFRSVGEVYDRTGCDLIGHFDLFSKFNEKVPRFDAAHPRYRAAWQRAAERLLQSGRPFEINTGAMSRGWRTGPYPSPEICAWLAARGARFVLSSDSHSAETLCHDFARQAKLAEAAGIRLSELEIFRS